MLMDGDKHDDVVPATTTYNDVDNGIDDGDGDDDNTDADVDDDIDAVDDDYRPRW